MIFTIGHTASYEVGIDRSGDGFMKLGRCELEGRPYGGGSIWRTLDEAEAYLDSRGLPDYSVYGVLADFEADTEQLPDEPYRRLLRDSQIVRIRE